MTLIFSQEPNIRCFVAKPVLSRVTRTWEGGSKKVTNDDEGEGEGGGVTIPPKNDDVIYEQPLTRSQVPQPTCQSGNQTTLHGTLKHFPRSNEGVSVVNKSQSSKIN